MSKKIKLTVIGLSIITVLSLLGMTSTPETAPLLKYRRFAPQEKVFYTIRQGGSSSYDSSDDSYSSSYSSSDDNDDSYSSSSSSYSSGSYSYGK